MHRDTHASRLLPCFTLGDCHAQGSRTHYASLYCRRMLFEQAISPLQQVLARLRKGGRAPMRARGILALCMVLAVPLEIVRHYLQLKGFRDHQVLEAAIWEDK